MRFLVLLTGLALAAAGCAGGPALRNGVSGGQVVAEARKQLGATYRYGGMDPDKGFDCSGLVAYCYGRLGIRLPHSTAALFKQGRTIPKGKLQPGDLVFFNTDGFGPSHVGIYSGGDKMVHAPSSGSKVREEKISIPYWKSRFLRAKRLD